MFQMFNKSKFNTISVHDIDDLLGKVQLIDIREPYEYSSGHIPTAKNIPMNVILSTPEKYLDKSNEYHIICQSGGRSTMACDELARKGYNIVNVQGGTGSYLRGLEV